ncbi:MAG: thioredoxin family protein [Verrucomicrobiota bacterium]
MKKSFTTFIFLLASLWALTPNHTQAQVTAKLISEQSSIQPGQPFRLGLLLEMEEGWHTYHQNPGDAGFPPSVTWDLPEGYTVTPLSFPEPIEFLTADIQSFGYKNEVLHITTITPPRDQTVGDSVVIKGVANWLACEEVCIPQSADLEITLKVSDKPLQLSGESTLFKKYEVTKHAASKKTSAKDSNPITPLSAILFAFIGGLILNLMPCVFPVLSLKIFGFVSQSGHDPWKTRVHGLVFATGVLISFWVLAGALLTFRSAGAELGWGFQLQSPLFIALLGLLFFGLALNMAGVFEIGTSFIGLAGKSQNLGGHADSFLSGVLATLVATPCTAPFMGASLGFALTQPAYVSMLIFTSLGIGMATPYVILSFFPKLLSFLPKPGPWMESFKQGMSFLLFATVIWLIWVLNQQIGADGVLRFMVGLLGFAIAAWVYGRWTTPLRSKSVRGFAWVLSLILVALSLTTAWPSQEDSKWQDYTPSLVTSLRENNEPVFIDFTAAWCVTCQVNKKVALRTEEVEARFDELKVQRIKADWTNKNPEITKALESYNRSGVPLYVLYAPGRDKPILLPEILTPQIVLDALDQLEPSS